MSAMLHIPATPTHPVFRSPNSSPSQFEPPSSPLAGLSSSARRASQYKSRTPARRTLYKDQTTPTGSRPAFASLSASAPPPRLKAELSQTSLLRERFRARCEERAAQARADGIRRSRYASSEAGSSDVDMGDDDDEGEDAFMGDELYRRIMLNKVRKEAHNYRLSYAQEVGSSLDPDMIDVAQWENETRGDMQDPPVDILEDYDEDDLAAYAEQMQQEEDWEKLAEQIFAGDDEFDAMIGATYPRGDVNMAA